MYKKTILITAAVVGLLAAQAAQAATPVGDPLIRPALETRAPARAYLTSVARAASRLVAVGEHGVIVLSDDGGTNWRQAKVPTSVTLTAVQFPSPKQGWAVGHYGIVLHSEDGGETWSRQLDGIRAAALAMQDAQAAAGQGASGERYMADVQRLVQDGPDKPFLGLYFTDERNGYVVGAYNLAFRTSDGGKSWKPCMRQLDNPKGSHLYAVRARGNAVYIAGEQGLVLRSTDAGQSFVRLDTGYKGSFFVMALADKGDELVVAGLRGNAYRSNDKGAGWEKLEPPVPASITALSIRDDGSLLLANQAGQLLAGSSTSKVLVALKTPVLPPLNDLLLQPDGSVVAVSMFGAMRLPSTAGIPTDPMAAK